ncbi:MAG: hypothetical protein R3C44_14715 [Chloroflexota bacterium]
MCRLLRHRRQRAVIPTEVPPTAVPEPTEAPTETPEPEGIALPEGLCANPYFPVAEGVSYTYQTDIPDLGPSITTFTFANVTPTSFDMLLGDDETNYVTYTWQCLEDGLLSPSIQFNTPGPDITVEAVEASGFHTPHTGQYRSWLHVDQPLCLQYPYG